MRLFIDSVMVFLGTLIAAGLLALTGPAGLAVVTTQHVPWARDAAPQILAPSHRHSIQKASLARAPH